jgi:hypothetical protein
VLLVFGVVVVILLLAIYLLLPLTIVIYCSSECAVYSAHSTCCSVGKL